MVKPLRLIGALTIRRRALLERLPYAVVPYWSVYHTPYWSGYHTPPRLIGAFTMVTPLRLIGAFTIRRRALLERYFTIRRHALLERLPYAAVPY